MLYQVITQKKNKIKWVCIILLTLLIMFLLYNYKKISGDNFYYYLFSTIAQGFLALVGVLGTAVVYRLQLIENDLNSVCDKLISIVARYRGDAVYGYSWTDFKNQRSQLEKSFENLPSREVLKVLLKKNDELSDNRGEIRNSIVDFSIVAFLDVAMAVLGIPLVSIFAGNYEIFGILPYYLLGVIFAISNILLSLYLLLLSFKIVRSIFGYSFKF
ncbi:MAG: hypothetical protein WC719_03010 [Patescibacteria group bacterium]|jgi:hypothetical protein